MGADDKNGIYLALLAIREFPVIKAAFFHGEETGCLGSKACDISFFDDCRFVVQCDRKGSSDFIIQGNGVDLSSEEFETDCELEKFGYKEANGASTDVVALKQRGLKVSCCNISCGYYDPHTDHEYTVWNDLVKCWMLVKHILSLTKTYPHEYVAPKIMFSHTTNWKSTSEFNGSKSCYVHENEKPSKHSNTLTYGYCQTRISTNRKSIVEKITASLVLDLNTQRHNAEILLQSYYEMSDFMPSKGNLQELYDDNKHQFKDIPYKEFTDIYDKLVRSYGYN